MAINTEKTVVLVSAATSENTNVFRQWLARLLAVICVLVCLVFGLAGVVLPIIPGLLFLAIAAMIAARHIPSLDRWLRKNPTLRRYLESGQGFLSLPWQQKIQFILWLSLKILLDTLTLLFSAVFSLLSVRRFGAKD